MKLLKAVILLLFLIGLFGVVTPVLADAPGTNEDPFGGFPITGLDPNGIGPAARFGLTPSGGGLPGGIPSFKSGDGSTPRKAINISGIWGGLVAHGAPGGEDADTTFVIQPPQELPNCATLKIPAGQARWFKLEAYDDRRTQIWLDDELDGATRASGSSVWGAANQYMYGTTPGGGWQVNAFPNSVPQSPNFLEGFVMAVYDPDSLQPLGAFDPPNAAILSVNTDPHGLLLSGPDDISIADATPGGIHGYGNFNPNVPKHLLWYEARLGGWVFVAVYNQMVWDGTASVCSQRVW